MGNNSIENSISRSGGIPGNSSGNTSGYSHTTLIVSRGFFPSDLPLSLLLHLLTCLC
jgi:hypothetical protein